MTVLCWLCLGSNHEAANILPHAREMLTAAFPDIHFGTERITRPVDFPAPAPFTNQIAYFRSFLSPEEIRKIFKGIESSCGRKAEDKARGIVRMDIDLLQHGDHVLKPRDMSYPHVEQGIRELRHT